MVGDRVGKLQPDGQAGPNAGERRVSELRAGPAAVNSVPEQRAPLARPLEWRVHLAREKPGRIPVLAGIFLLTAALAYALFQNLLIAGAAVMILATSTAEFLFPIRYRLDADAAELRNGISLRRIEWSQVRAVHALSDGAKLSPLGHPSRLEAYRGLFLRFAGNREEVLAAIDGFRAAARGEG